MEEDREMENRLPIQAAHDGPRDAEVGAGGSESREDKLPDWLAKQLFKLFV